MQIDKNSIVSQIILRYNPYFWMNKQTMCSFIWSLIAGLFKICGIIVLWCIFGYVTLDVLMAIGFSIAYGEINATPLAAVIILIFFSGLIIFFALILLDRILGLLRWWYDSLPKHLNFDCTILVTPKEPK